MYVYIWLSLSAVHRELSQRCSSAIPQYEIQSFIKIKKKEILTLVFPQSLMNF